MVIHFDPVIGEGMWEFKKTKQEPQETFKQWAVVELMGHGAIAGLISEEAYFGLGFMRVDVPAVNDQPAFTKFFGGSAIYAFSPTTEEVAAEAARRLDIRPASYFYSPQLENQPANEEDEFEVPF